MIDRIDLFIADGGPAGLGYLKGIKEVDPGRVVFQGPFLPGSRHTRIARAGIVPATHEVRSRRALGMAGRGRSLLPSRWSGSTAGSTAGQVVHRHDAGLRDAVVKPRTFTAVAD